MLLSDTNNFVVDRLQHVLASCKELAVEPTLSINLSKDMMNDTLQARVVHSDGYSKTITAYTIEELVNEVHNYLDPWRQYKESL